MLCAPGVVVIPGIARPFPVSYVLFLPTLHDAPSTPVSDRSQCMLDACTCTFDAAELLECPRLVCNGLILALICEQSVGMLLSAWRCPLSSRVHYHLVWAPECNTSNRGVAAGG